MSADNGIYILESPAGDGMMEYRVAHTQAIDNLDFYREQDNQQEYEDYLKRTWGSSEVFRTEDAALVKAKSMYDELIQQGYPIEYGISDIVIDHMFPQ